MKPIAAVRPTSLDPENQLAAGRLVECLQHGAIAFIGAGVSVQYALPSWHDLLDRLHGLAKRKARWNKPESRQIAQLEDALWRAQLYENVLGASAFRTEVCRLFSSFERGRSDLARKLVALPFSHYITTNYDEVLESELRYRYGKDGFEVIDWAVPDQSRRFARNFSNHQALPFLVYLHGRHSLPESIVLTEADYNRRYALNDETRKKLFALFAAKSVVFIGFSLSDPDLITTLREVNASLGFSEEVARHFAILSLKETDPHAGILRERYRNRFGVEPVFYEYSRDHRQLDLLIDNLNSHNFEAIPTNISQIETEDDPQKGRWGGANESKTRRLTAQVSEISSTWFRIDVKLEAKRRSIDLVGPIRFHLHDSFDPDVLPAETLTRRTAAIELQAYGAFTIGVSADKGQTRLELDLSKLPDAPRRFRES